MKEAVAATVFVAWALAIGWLSAKAHGWAAIVTLLVGVFVGTLLASRAGAFR